MGCADGDWTLRFDLGGLGPGPLTEAGVREWIRPLFSKVLAREEVYLANHSLGRPLDQMAEDVAEGVAAWYGEMDGAWGAWFGEIQSFRGSVARLLGLPRADLVVPKTAAGQGLRAVLNALPGRPLRVVATRGEFDSVDFILKTYRDRGLIELRWVEATGDLAGVPVFDGEAVAAAIEPGTDLVVVSQVVFATGQVLPGLDRVVERANGVGAKVLLDTYHSFGVLPVDLVQIGADFAIGGSYKYVRGGPGACWLALHPRLAGGELQTLDTGWFAKRSPFSYERTEGAERAEGGDGWLESTPPVLTMYQARAGLAFLELVGVERLRSYTLERVERLRARVPGMLRVEMPEAWGAYALLPVADAAGFADALRERGVNTDARGGCVRFGPDVLTTDEEIDRAAAVTGELLGVG